jgi:sulfide dehydrogenase cytochrome subunit
MLSNTCFGCHGPEGVSEGPATPTIAGMAKSYFINAMLAYKYAGEEGRDAKLAETISKLKLDPDEIDVLDRKSTVMTRIAQGYSDDEILALAEFFSSKPFKGVAQKADAKLVKEGEKVHKKQCEKCHEDNGHKSDGAGRMAGQWMPYLEFTLADFLSADKHRVMPKKMAEKAKNLTPDEIKAVIHFYGSQK